MTFNLQVDAVLQRLLSQEDTDGDKKITIDDRGPKRFTLKDTDGNAVAIEGTYRLANLLQELALAKKKNLATVKIAMETIMAPPAERLSGKIKHLFWAGLTRTTDEHGIAKIFKDSKIHNAAAYIYVPAADTRAFDYFKKLESRYANAQVIRLPENISEEYVLSLNKKPGILALALREEDGKIKGVPFVVPGGRFNEMYGWDSYFIALGLITDGKIAEAKDIAENLKYQIDYYGKILNANRSYYLTRTQPPLYTSLLMDIVAKKAADKTWLERHLKAAIKEYETVWMEMGNRLTETGLNRYHAGGVGLPFETEPGHFDYILETYAKKYNLPLREFEKKYLEREIVDAALDAHFVHDRSMRESGHDTTNRLVDVCADLNTVAVNSLLYKYETEIAFLIETFFENSFLYKEGFQYSSNDWKNKAEQRKKIFNDLCWNEAEGIYFDYNFVKKKQHVFEAATTFYPLWAKLASKKQAEALVKKTLPKFKMKCGVAGSTKETIAHIDDGGIQRQWDYPFGWPPHQILLWQGLLNYGYAKEAQEMTYRWLWLITKTAADFNGMISEKFNLETSSHKVFAEYGNVGTQFDYITEEGFGWTNASYQYGLTLLSDTLRQELNKLTDPDMLF